MEEKEAITKLCYDFFIKDVKYRLNSHYEFVRISFVLTNSTKTFQRLMDNILSGLNNDICLLFLDDILTFSTSLQEHIIRL